MQGTFVLAVNSQVDATFTDRVVCIFGVSPRPFYTPGGEGRRHAIEKIELDFWLSDWPVFCVPQQPVNDHLLSSVRRGNAGNRLHRLPRSSGERPGWCVCVTTGDGGIAGGLLRLKMCAVVCI